MTLLQATCWNDDWLTSLPNSTSFKVSHYPQGSEPEVPSTTQYIIFVSLVFSLSTNTTIYILPSPAFALTSLLLFPLLWGRKTYVHLSIMNQRLFSQSQFLKNISREVSYSPATLYRQKKKKAEIRLLKLFSTHFHSSFMENITRTQVTKFINKWQKMWSIPTKE